MNRKFFILIHLWSLSLELVGTLTDSKCNLEGNPIQQSFSSYSDLSQIRSAYKPFVYYDSIKAPNIKAKHVPDQIFTDLCVNTIDLSANEIEFISYASFSGIVHLKTLILSKNKLESIDELLNSLNTSDLAELYLSSNQIIRLDGVKFPSSLTLLDLSRNRLKYIGNCIFTKLTDLKLLDLSSNQIKQISYQAFEDLTSLKSLNLDKNQLEQLNVSFTRLSNLTKLTIESNKLSIIHSFAGLNNLIELELTHNELIGDSLSFKGLVSLIKLCVRTNSLGSLSQFTFDDLTNLNELDLKQSKIESIQNDTFNNLYNLVELDLSNNKLATLFNGVFNGLVRLQRLDLNSNIISTIEPLVFRPLMNLNNLFLNDNLLKSIPSDLFLNLNSLYTVQFAYNQIKVINTGFLRNLPFLKEVDLSRNSIEKIEVDSFVNLTGIKTLDLSVNKLKIIKPFYFSELSTLEFLYLKENGINTIEKGSFKGFNDCYQIVLNDNYLISIDSGAFTNLKSNYLDLTRNQLDDFDSNILFSVDINTFILAYNNLKTLGKDSFRNLITVKIFDLGFNKLNSISEFLFGLNVTSNAKTLYLNNNQLSEISFLNGIQFMNLIELDLSCNLIERLISSHFSELSKLNHLNLAHNHIKFIGEGFLSKICLTYLNLTNISYSFNVYNMSKLEILDLSLNKLVNFSSKSSSLQELYLKDVSLNIKTLDFFLIRNLTKIDLSENLEDGYFTLDGIFSLEWINLSKIGIVSIMRFNFSQFEKLIYLNLSCNEIEFIENSYFAELYYLIALDLSNNKIEWFEKGSFDDMCSSSIDLYCLINLENNRIKQITMTFQLYLIELNLKNNTYLQDFQVSVDDIFEWIYLEKIDLSHNSLESLSFFVPISNQITILRYIFLNSNRFEKIERGVFNGLDILRSVDLSANRISFVDNEAFQNLDQLIYLNLADNRLENLDERTFSNLIHLETLNLSANYLKSISSSLFSDLFNLVVLDLSSNQLLDLFDYSFKNLGLVKRLYIQNNPLMTFYENTFSGLEAILELFVSFKQIADKPSKAVLMNSLEPQEQRRVSDLIYYRSINILYEFDLEKPEIDCNLFLEYLRKSIQVNLKTDYQFVLYLSFCGHIDLFVS